MISSILCTDIDGEGCLVVLLLLLVVIFSILILPSLVLDFSFECLLTGVFLNKGIVSLVDLT